MRTINYKIFKKKNYLILDFLFTQKINFQILNNNYNIIKSPSKTINLNFFIKIFFSKKLLRIFVNDSLRVAYYASSIATLQPLSVITANDNSLDFYKLKKYFPNVKFLSIQNSIRRKLSDFFGNPEINKGHLSCDTFFLLGDCYRNIYKRYIKSKFITLGSVQNNFITTRNAKVEKNTLAYISQFDYDLEGKFMNHYGIKKIEYKKVYTNHQIFLLNLIHKYCEIKKIKFYIISRTTNSKEEIFYKNLKFLKHYKYFKYCDINKKIQFLSKCEVITTQMSTLAYEMLARGKKVAFFSPRDYFGLNDRRFGWPEKIRINGKFYTSNTNDKNVNKILNYLFKNNSNKYSQKLIKKLITYNNISKSKKIIQSELHY
jgi:surface carbohydrate biosynthesis protein